MTYRRDTHSLCVSSVLSVHEFQRSRTSMHQRVRWTRSNDPLPLIDCRFEESRPPSRHVETQRSGAVSP